MRDFPYWNSQSAFLNAVILNFLYSVIWFCASNTDVVNIMLHAQKLGMTNGDFVFIFYTRNPLEEGVNLRVWEMDAPENMSAVEWAHRRQAFYPVKMVSSSLNTLIRS